MFLLGSVLKLKMHPKSSWKIIEKFKVFWSQIAPLWSAPRVLKNRVKKALKKCIKMEPKRSRKWDPKGDPKGELKRHKKQSKIAIKREPILSSKIHPKWS